MDKKEAILVAALDEFCAYDYAQASLNRIIRNSSTSKGTFYHYFESKEDLYHTLLLQVAQKKKAVMRPPSGDLRSDLLLQLQDGIAFAKEHPAYFQLYQRMIRDRNLPAVLNNTSSGTITQTTDLTTIPLATTSTSTTNTMPQVATNPTTNSLSHTSDDYPPGFLESFVGLLLRHMHELFSPDDDLVQIEYKTSLVMQIITEGIKPNH